MKNLILLFILVTCGSLTFAQTAKKFTSGDTELDNAIKNITAYGRKNPDTFQKTLIAKYSITETQAAEYFGKYTAGDLMMIFETAKASNKEAKDIFTTYNTNKGNKGWDETLKELGVKKDSDKFEAIKTAMVNNGLI